VNGSLKSAAESLPPADKSLIEYQLQPGDIIESHYSSDPSLNEQILVAPDGRVNFFSASNIFAAGLTLPQLRNKIIGKAQIVDTSFDIVLRSSVGIRVYVTGEVATPGEIVSNGQISALQAVSRAGGLKLSAQGGEVVLIRHDDSTNDPKVYAIDLTAALNGAKPKEDVLLRPYDIIYVPRDRIGNASLVLERLRNAVPFVFSFVYGNGNAKF
jgi:polysaccharide export outer membrane protein